MFKKVLFAIVCFPLAIIDAIASLVSILIVVLGRFIFGWTDGKDEYNDLLETKVDGWTGLKENLEFDD